MLKNYFKVKYSKFYYFDKKSTCSSKINIKKNFSANIQKFSAFLHFNKRNTRVTLSNPQGFVVFTCTSGNLGYKKSKRGDPFVVAQLFSKFSEYVKKHNINNFSLFLKGYSRARRPMIKLFNSSMLRKNCVAVLDVSKSAHNGCRLRAKRRL